MSAPEPYRHDLVEKLERAMNGAENGSNTPDFILADYLLRCLEAFDATSTQREKWYGVKLSPGEGDVRIKRSIRAHINALPDDRIDWLWGAFACAAERAEVREALCQLLAPEDEFDSSRTKGEPT